MSFRLYKTLRAVATLIAVAAGFYAMHRDADPALIYGFIATILVGPDALEARIAGRDTTSTDDSQHTPCDDQQTTTPEQGR